MACFCVISCHPLSRYTMPAFEGKKKKTLWTEPMTRAQTEVMGCVDPERLPQEWKECESSQ